MIFFWGFSFVVVDIAIEFVTPLSIALYRLIISSISLALITFYLNFRRKSQLNNQPKVKIKKASIKRYWSFIILASTTGVAGYLFIIYTAVSYIGPSIPSFTDCLLSPIFITFISIIFFKEKITRNKIIGFVIASFGSYLLITGGNIEILIAQNPNLLGYLFALLSPIFWSSYTIIIKKLKELNMKEGKNDNDIINLSYISYFGCLELFLLVIFRNEFTIFTSNILNPIVLGSAIFLALGPFIIGYYIWNFSFKKFESSNVASFLYIQPFLTLLFSLLFQRNDPITFWNIFGGIIVLVAVFIINFKQVKIKKED